MEEEELIEYYSYYYSDREGFVKEYLENYKEMDIILKTIFENIDKMKKDYNITLNESSICFENKKTKEHYFVRIEF